MKALVTGGTGTLGRLVVPRLRDAGLDVRVLSRSSREAEDIEFVPVTWRQARESRPPSREPR